MEHVFAASDAHDSGLCAADCAALPVPWICGRVLRTARLGFLGERWCPQRNGRRMRSGYGPGYLERVDPTYP